MIKKFVRRGYFGRREKKSTSPCGVSNVVGQFGMNT